MAPRTARGEARATSHPRWGSARSSPPAWTRSAVTVRWGDYTVGERRGRGDGERTREPEPPRRVWQRRSAGADDRGAAERQLSVPRVIPVPDSGGLELHVAGATVAAARIDGRIPAGTRAVSLFLVNDRDPDPKQRPIARTRSRRSSRWAASSRSSRGPTCASGRLRTGTSRSPTCTMPTRRSSRPATASRPTGSSATASAGAADAVDPVRPRSSRPIPADVEGVELRMEALGALADGAAAQAALCPLVSQYREWIEARESEVQGLAGERRSRPRRNCWRLAGFAAARIERGIATLAGDADALDAFRVANRAVARALRRRLREMDEPAWRPFQLAFILMNLPGIADPADPHRRSSICSSSRPAAARPRRTSGLAAFAIVLRRLRHPDAGRLTGAGVSVDHALHAAAADAGPALARRGPDLRARARARRQTPGRYGDVAVRDRPVGREGGHAERDGPQGRRAHRHGAHARSASSRTNRSSKPSPIPLEECPWCGTPFSRTSFTLLPDADQPRELRIVCTNLECDFTRDRALPIVAVDEPIYRRLPAFLIATVDKFAALPWVGRVGRAARRRRPRTTRRLLRRRRAEQGHAAAAPLPPPDLVIQDELHLISGPLGTMAGLYETAIEALCARSSTAQPCGRRSSPRRRPCAARRTRSRRCSPPADADLPAARPRPARLVLRTHRARVEALRRGAMSASPPRAATRRS